MTIDPKHRSPCPTGKLRYLDGKSAHAAIERVARTERKKPGQRLMIYQCPDCRLWHIGHSKHWS